MQKIQLSDQVFVSDPCYDRGTWCQLKVNNVLPGAYYAQVEIDEKFGRNAVLRITHEKYIAGKASNLQFRHLGEAGVDSGQLGIFDFMSYRNDQHPVLPAALHASKDSSQEWTVGKYSQSESKQGESWYDHICSHTCNTEDSWGTYDSGVVSSSGWGDGVYDVYAAYNDQQQVVAIEVEFMAEENPEGDEWPDDDNDCVECGVELESDGSCNYCEHFANSKKED